MTAKKPEEKKRSKWLHLRLTDQEYKKLSVGFSGSTKQKISEYARDILLDKPITVYTRNQSYDDFVAEIILLKAELKAIGNNFNQTVRKLNSFSAIEDVKQWALLSENSKQILFKKMEEINLKINQINDKWSQE